MLVPGCDGEGGSAGDPCLLACLYACLLVCSGWVAAGWPLQVLSKEKGEGEQPTLATHPGDPPWGGGGGAGDPKLLSNELPAKFKIWARMRPNFEFCGASER